MPATRDRPEWADWPRVLVRVSTTSRDRTVPDAPARVALCDPDGEPWAIDPEHYRRIHRPAVTGRLARDPVDWERRLWSVLGYVPALIALLLVALFVYAAFREMAP